jgi:hypothetical protein
MFIVPFCSHFQIFQKVKRALHEFGVPDARTVGSVKRDASAPSVIFTEFLASMKLQSVS